MTQSSVGSRGRLPRAATAARPEGTGRPAIRECAPLCLSTGPAGWAIRGWALDHRHPELPPVPPAGQEAGSGADREAGGGQALLHLGDGELAEVEDRWPRARRRRRPDEPAEVPSVPGAAAGDHRHSRGADRGDELEVVAGLRAVARPSSVRRISPAPSRTPRSAQSSASMPVGRAAAVRHDLPPLRRRLGRARASMDRRCTAPRTRAAPRATSSGSFDGGGVERRPCRRRPAAAARRPRRADPAADGERDEHLLGGAATTSTSCRGPSLDAVMSRKTSSSAPSAS